MIEIQSPSPAQITAKAKPEASHNRYDRAEMLAERETRRETESRRAAKKADERDEIKSDNDKRVTSEEKQIVPQGEVADGAESFGQILSAILQPETVSQLDVQQEIAVQPQSALASATQQADLPVVDAPPMQTPLPPLAGAVSPDLPGVAPVVGEQAAPMFSTPEENGTPHSIAVPNQSLLASTQLTGTNTAPLSPVGTSLQGAPADILSGSGFSGATEFGDKVFTERAGLNSGGEARGMTLSGPASAAQAGTQASALNQTSFETLLSSVNSQGSATGQASIDTALPAQSMASTEAGTSSANAATQAAKDPVLAHRALTHTGVEIAKQALAGRTRFEIRLDPPELGRVEVRMIMDKEKAAARIMVERPETLDMLMRDRAQLERILAASGMSLEGGIDMQLKSDGDAENFSGMLQGGEGSPDAGSDRASDTAENDALALMSAAQIAAAELNPLSLNRIA